MLQIQIPTTITTTTTTNNTKYPTSPNWNEKLSFKSLDDHDDHHDVNDDEEIGFFVSSKKETHKIIKKKQK